MVRSRVLNDEHARSLRNCAAVLSTVGAMEFSVFSIEHTLEAACGEAGDATFSPVFSRPVKKCPVLHLFGYLSTRQTACVHVHGFLPYFFVPKYSASLNEVDFASQLELAAQRVLADPLARVVHDVSTTQAVPFYGMATERRAFLRIEVYNPSHVRRLAVLLSTTVQVCGRRWQPYEAHVPFHFQVMIDTGFSGMSVVTAADALIRRGAEHLPEVPDSPFAPETTAAVEVDVRKCSFNTGRVRPGAQLDYAKTLLDRYVESAGLPSSFLNDALASNGLDRASARSAQDEDPFNIVMRKRAVELAHRKQHARSAGAAGPDDDVKNLKWSWEQGDALDDTECVAPSPVQEDISELVQPTFAVLEQLRDERVTPTSHHDESSSAASSRSSEAAAVPHGVQFDDAVLTAMAPNHVEPKAVPVFDPEETDLIASVTTACDSSQQTTSRNLVRVTNTGVGPPLPTACRRVSADASGARAIAAVEAARAALSQRARLPSFLSAHVDRLSRLEAARRGSVAAYTSVKAKAAGDVGRNCAARVDGQGTHIAQLCVACVEVLAIAPDGKHADARCHPLHTVVCVFADASLDHRRSWCLSCAERPAACPPEFRFRSFANEQQLLRAAVAMLRDADPDVVVSWDTQRGGVGYLSTRCELILGESACAALSRGAATWRAPADDVQPEVSPFGQRSEAPSGDGARSERQPLRRQTLRIFGRVVIGMWRVVRSEVKLTSYTLQGIFGALFGETVPFIADDMLARLATDPVNDQHRALALSHVCMQAHRVMRLARHLDIFVRTTELAQIYGILFVEVLSRGSQFRVESVLLRFAKPAGYCMISTSREQVATQNKQEGIALVMEPFSGYYTDPVVVLDFRSLYPSIVIAYNLCYCTLTGKISERERVKIGAVANYKPPKWDPSSAVIAPNSAMFGDVTLRRGVLPEMLERILNTRFMVQACMKHAGKTGKEEQRRVFDAQQTGLKLLANVTYGYTAATFSGRMPCSDIADAIVLLGRKTLERAIRLIEGNATWNAKVVYGDTDSLFVQLRGASRREAFDVAQQMVAAVNRRNPRPVQLKFEKVFHPCFMVVKKRYVGYAFESLDQRVPKFDAKGIEAIRRDQCRLVSQTQTEMLRLLFDTNDVAILHTYFIQQLSKLQRGMITPTDLILRREVKLGSYVKDSTLPPGARVALRMMEHDAACAPLQGERVPYLVVRSPGSQLKDMVVHPSVLLGPDAPEVHAAYYIEKHLIPSLQRIFHLVGVDCTLWYRQMPRLTASHKLLSTSLVTWSRQHGLLGLPAVHAHSAHPTIDTFYQRNECATCGAREVETTSAEPPLCITCLGTNRSAALHRAWRVRRNVEVLSIAQQDECRRCMRSTANLDAGETCTSVDCATTFGKARAAMVLRQWNLVVQYLSVAPRAVAPRLHTDAADGQSVAGTGTHRGDALQIDL